LNLNTNPLDFICAWRYNLSMSSADRHKKAVAYSRVSTLLNQDPTIQLSAIRDFAQSRGFVLVDEYTDQGISGAKERRPSLDRMISDARRGKFKVLIVTGIDRIGRNTRHLLNLIAELNEYGVSIISIREGLDFTTSVGKATLGILAVVSELERDLIRERIKSAMAQKKLTAEKSGTKWKCGRPSVKTDLIQIQVLELFSKGRSSREIAKLVGISKSSVQRILRAGPKPSKNESSQVRENLEASHRTESENPVSQKELVLVQRKRDDER
jgi:DNA invertase Pin-like site-specific DNA recombinase